MALPETLPRTNVPSIDEPFTQTVSVVMPVRNEEDFIRESLEAVLAQDYPPHLVDIVVADGMSTDRTREIIREMQAAHPNITLVDNPGKIAPTGLNAGLSRATGEIIVRVDGHCVIQPDYVRQCVLHLAQEEDVAGVGGPMETIGETGTAQAIALAMSSLFGVGGSAFRTVRDRKMFVDTVAFPAYRHETIKRAGLFDEELVRNQDDEYNFRLREMGGRILMTPAIRSRYYSRSSFRSLWRQYFQYGFWKVRVMQKHPRQMSLRQFVPPAFVAGAGFLAVLSLFTALTRKLLALLIGVYAAANIAATVVTLFGSRGASGGSQSGTVLSGIRRIPLLSLAYAILHFSYGAGFLYGLVKFAKRWRGAGANGR